MERIRVMLAEDHSMVRQGLKQLIERRRHQGSCRGCRRIQAVDYYNIEDPMLC